ncbi:MAG: FecR family protein [Nitrospiraceae bacterium]|jgi:hypothetical protein|uniref:FecR family protein n=1 Tax=Nitrospira cf. moscoviensis SBR1015 TaxID=96242 RepID=UPI000A0A8CD5|nr:FecR family protein [Nitrospira cf. moscoviensis SBR1015]MBY0248655.1 FecR family protein [Nitrospiraceae bacterium]OQW35966.1 MAG: hypothetical protein A4E20_08435 [Nitrospira sp. SG-bin2]
MSIYRLVWGLIGISALSVSSVAFASDIKNKRDGIGFYTAVVGQVSVTHPSEGPALLVKLHDTVLFKDVIQTYTESRTRAFFQDDSMLTVGENSRVEINEYIYEPDQNVRRAIVKLMQGQVRALVSKVFKANGSKFEVHTPSAVAAARGTYFTVWAANGRSGIINIGEKGRVDFTSGGTTVAVDPGFFSIAEDGKAPSLPMPHHLGETAASPSSSLTYNSAILGYQGTIHLQTGKSMQTDFPVGLTDALRAVDLTTLRDSPLVELPLHTLQALSIDTNLLRSLTDLAVQVLGSSGESSSTLITGTLGTLLNKSVPVGSLSIGTSTTTVAPLTSTVSTVAAPVTSVVSTVVAPVSPLISTVVTPVAPVLSTVVAPLAPVVSPIIAPVAPLVNPVLATPPAVISGALSLLP